MIQKIIPIVLQAVFVFGGVAGGIYLKSSGMLGGAKAEAHAAEGEDHGEGEESGGHGEAKKDKKDKKKDKGGHGEAKGGHGESSEPGDDKGVIKFSRQFVVPVMHGDGQNSLIVFDIAIEVPPGASEGLYTFEPRLRDAVLSALLKLSNEGVFNDQFFGEGNLSVLRSSLRDAAKTIIGDDAEQILILNIARQSP
jgi:hypothetical protein